MSKATSNKATAWRNAHPAWRPKVCNSAGHGNTGITGRDSEGFCADNIYLGLGSNLLGGDLLSGDLHASLGVFTILFFFICLLLSLGGSAFLAQVSGLSTCPTGLLREPGGVIPLPFLGIALCCESLGVSNIVELGPQVSGPQLMHAVQQR